MPELIVNYPDRASDVLPLGRLRITIGRSARNDLCIPDPFASRVHAEVRREGDQYFLQDLGSANGTYYDGARAEGPLPLDARRAHPDRRDRDRLPRQRRRGRADRRHRRRGGRRARPRSDHRVRLRAPHHLGPARSHRGRAHADLGPPLGARPARHAAPRPARRRRARRRDQSDLLALISKVGVTLLASATLDETLRQVARLVFEAVPAERCLIMLRDAGEKELKVRAAELRNHKPDVGEIRVSRTIVEEVVGQGRSVLTSDAQHDPRFMSSTVTFQGIRSVLAVPLGVGAQIFGMIYADSPLTEARFTEDHLKVLTTLGSVAAIRVEKARAARRAPRTGAHQPRAATGARDTAALPADLAARRQGLRVSGHQLPVLRDRRRLLRLHQAARRAATSSRSATCRARAPPPRS